MTLYSPPPPVRPFSEDKPTLLVCWWTTIFCAVLILLRIAGRFVRTERLFREDKVAALALVPLFLRMGCVHVVLIYGTNNVDLNGVEVTAEDIRRREIGSKLVLVSRVLYAATLWVLKSAILEFLARINANWERRYEITLYIIRALLAATFVAVIISDLTECRPFPNYWQVLPDPGSRCRQGYAQLLTMAVSNVFTDLLLVSFPIPIIVGSMLPAKRKFQLVLLFSLSLAPVAVTLYRVPHILKVNGRQQTRSLYASVELLFATAAANALVLGSFVRDRGVKKRRWKYDSIAAHSMDNRSSIAAASITGTGGVIVGPVGAMTPRLARRPSPAGLRHWGSDEDLARDLGYGVTPELREIRPSEERGEGLFFYRRKCAPVVGGNAGEKPDLHLEEWHFPDGRSSNSQVVCSGAAQSDEENVPPPPGGAGVGVSSASERGDVTPNPRRVSFLDEGGLLIDTRGESDDRQQQQRPPSIRNGTISPNSDTDPSPTSPSPTPQTPTPSSRPRTSTTTTPAPATPATPTPLLAPPTPTIPASTTGIRRGSAALLTELGRFLTPQQSHTSITTAALSASVTGTATATDMITATNTNTSTNNDNHSPFYQTPSQQQQQQQQQQQKRRRPKLSLKKPSTSSSRRTTDRGGEGGGSESAKSKKMTPTAKVTPTLAYPGSSGKPEPELMDVGGLLR